jgi:hypothetical protein
MTQTLYAHMNKIKIKKKRMPGKEGNQQTTECRLGHQ